MSCFDAKYYIHIYKPIRFRTGVQFDVKNQNLRKIKFRPKYGLNGIKGEPNTREERDKLLHEPIIQIKACESEIICRFDQITEIGYGTESTNDSMGIESFYLQIHFLDDNIEEIVSVWDGPKITIFETREKKKCTTI